MTATSLWLPTRPYGIVDAINRIAAATGSPRYAELASHVLRLVSVVGDEVAR